MGSLSRYPGCAAKTWCSCFIPLTRRRYAGGNCVSFGTGWNWLAPDRLLLGVNPGNARSHANFRNREELPFPLLVDAGQRVASLYHANGLAVKRTVYLVGKDGVIRFAKRGKPDPQEVLETADT